MDDLQPIYNEELDTYECPKCGEPCKIMGCSDDGDYDRAPQEVSWFQCLGPECGWVSEAD